MKFTDNQRNRLFLAYLVAIIVFQFSLGLNVIDPTNINWIMTARSDISQHYLGWEFFRYEDWTFPLGAIKKYAYPLGTNIGYTDSLPLLALIFKPFSSILPEHFQYFGLWLLFCHLMVAHYVIKILDLYSVKIIHALPVVAIVVGNSCLWFRYFHPALCAHGFILAGIYLYLKPAVKENVYRINQTQVLLTVLSSLIHPYLWAIIIGFNIIIPLKNVVYDKVLSFKKAIIYPVLTFVFSISLWLIVGLVDFGGGQSFTAATPFQYPLNLNILYNSWGESAFLPALSRGATDNYEGYMYLGLGMFGIILAAIAAIVVKPELPRKIITKKWLLPLFAFVFLMTIFAISNKAMIGDTVVYDINLPAPILLAGKVFRASARFFWIAYYLIMLFFSIVLIRSGLRKNVVLVILLCLTTLQAYDLKKLFTRNFPSGVYHTPLNDQNWENIMANYKEIITYTPFQAHNLNFADWQDFMYLALQKRKAITLGSTARDKVDEIIHYTDSITKMMETERLPKDNLYITGPKNLKFFGTQLYNKYLDVDYLDGYYVLYAPNEKFKISNPTPESVMKRDSVKRLYSQKAILTEMPNYTAKKIKYNLESYSSLGNVISARGWAFLEDTNDNKGDSIFISLKKGGKWYKTPVENVKREDLTQAFKKNLDDSGIFATLNTELTENDSVGIAIKSKNGDWALTPVGKAIAKSPYASAEKVDSLPIEDITQIGNIDGFRVNDKEIEISGWSALNTSDSFNQLQKVVLKSNSAIYVFDVIKVMRPDVTASLKTHNYDTCGFKVKIRATNIPKGQYKVGVLINDTGTGKQSVKFFNDRITK